MARRRSAPELSIAFGPPASSAEGAACLRSLLVDLFDRKDGTGADWELMLDATFRAAFGIADDRLDEGARRRLMQRVFTGAYDRAAGNIEGGRIKPENPDQETTGTASSKGAASKGARPRPPR